MNVLQSLPKPFTRKILVAFFASSTLLFGCLEGLNFGDSNNAIPQKDEAEDETQDTCFADCMAEITETLICKEGKWHVVRAPSKRTIKRKAKTIGAP